MKKFLIGLSVVMASFIIATVVLYRRSVSPYNQAKSEATTIANREAGLASVDDFHWYNGTETYFTVTGTTDEGEDRIIIIRQEDGNVVNLSANEVISEADAIQQVREEKSPERVLQARIGIEEDVPVWEVSYRNKNGRIGYYVMDLESGEWMRTIDNI